MRSLGTAVVASLALHALVVLVLNLPSLIPLPKSPIEIEVLPYERPKPKPVEVQPPTPPEPPKPKVAKATPGASKKPGEGPNPKAKPEKPPLPSTADLKPYAPSNVNLILILRTDKIRTSPHADFTDAVLAAMPDYDTFLGGTGLQAVRDFDALLIASADPTLVVETFLAARAKIGTPLAKLAARPLHHGDPRIVRVLGDDLAVLGKPEAMAPSDLGTSPESMWLNQLDKILDQKSEAPAVLATVNDLHRLIRIRNFPTPHDVELAITADAGPWLRLVARFATNDEAVAFQQIWPKLIADYKQQTRFLGISALFDGLQLTIDDTKLEIAGQLPETPTRVAFTWLKSLLPQRKTALPDLASTPRDLGADLFQGTPPP